MLLLQYYVFVERVRNYAFDCISQMYPASTDLPTYSQETNEDLVTRLHRTGQSLLQCRRVIRSTCISSKWACRSDGAGYYICLM